MEELNTNEALYEFNMMLYGATSKNKLRKMIKGFFSQCDYVLRVTRDGPRGIDPFLFYIDMMISSFPEALQGTEKEMHPKLEARFWDKVLRSVEDGTHLLIFCKGFFLFMDSDGSNPLTYTRIFKKISDVLATEAALRMIGEGGGIPVETWKELQEFLEPYIERALKSPFAQQEADLLENNVSIGKTVKNEFLLHTLSLVLKRIVSEG